MSLETVNSVLKGRNFRIFFFWIVKLEVAGNVALEK